MKGSGKIIKIIGYKGLVSVFTLAALAFLLVLPGAGHAQTAMDFYKGKTLKMLTAGGPGSGHDQYVRLYAAHLARFLPVDAVPVENVVGGGELIGHNKLYESTPDGLTIGGVNRGMMLFQIIGTKGIRFDLAKLTWLANMAAEPRLMVVSPKGKFTSLDAIRASKEFKIGTEGAGTTGHSDALIVKEVTKWPVKIVAGYTGTTEIQLAVVKGEVDANIGVYDTLYPMLVSGDIIPVLQMGGRKIKGLENLPLFKDIAPPGYEALMRLLDVQYSVSRLVAGPPGIPADRAALLREVFKKMAEDKTFLEAAAKAKRNIEFTPGEAIQKMMEEAMKVSQKDVDMLQDILVKK